MRLILVILPFLIQPLGAVTLDVIGKGGQVLLHVEQDVALPISVGQATVGLLAATETPFNGDASGIAAIAGLGSDLQVVSDQEFKAYGWCFSLDGEAPDVMPDQAPVLSQSSKIIWYYAFAHFKNGEWVSQCETD